MPRARPCRSRGGRRPSPPAVWPRAPARAIARAMGDARRRQDGVGRRIPGGDAAIEVEAERVDRRPASASCGLVAVRGTVGGGEGDVAVPVAPAPWPAGPQPERVTSASIPTSHRCIGHQTVSVPGRFRASLRSPDATDPLGGGAAPDLRGGGARAPPSRGRHPAEPPGGRRAHLRRDARGGAGRRRLRGGRGGRAAPPSTRRGHATASASSSTTSGSRSCSATARGSSCSSTRSAAATPPRPDRARRDRRSATAPDVVAPRAASADRARGHEHARARAIRVSSHYPFDRVNPRLEFDRAAARGLPPRPAGRRVGALGARRDADGHARPLRRRGGAGEAGRGEPPLRRGAPRALRAVDRRSHPPRRHRPVDPRRGGPPGARRRADLGLRQEHPARDGPGTRGRPVGARRRRRRRGRRRPGHRRRQGRHRHQGRPDRRASAGPGNPAISDGIDLASARTRSRSWATASSRRRARSTATST